MKANHRVAINLCTLIKQYLFILAFLSFGVGNKNAGRKFFKQQQINQSFIFTLQVLRIEEKRKRSVKSFVDDIVKTIN